MDADSRFCESCGVPVAEVPINVPNAPGCCPKCMQADQATAAAAFKDEDLSSLQEEERTDQEMAQLCLSAPEPPALPSRVLWAAVPFIPVVNAIMMWFAPIHKYYKLVMLAVAVAFIACVAVPELYKNDAYIIPGFVLVTVYYSGLIFDRKRQQAELEKKWLPEYQRKATNWLRLSYCRRCKVAWLSGQARFVPVEDVDDLLVAEPPISRAAK